LAKSNDKSPDSLAKSNDKSPDSLAKSNDTSSENSSDESATPKKGGPKQGGPKQGPPKFKKTKEYNKLVKEYKKLNEKIKNINVTTADKKAFKKEQTEIKNKIVELNPAAKFVVKQLPGKPKPYVFEPISPTQLAKVSDKVKQKLQNYLKHVREQKKLNYINEGHRKACATGVPDMKELTEPVQKFTKTLQYPMLRNMNSTIMSFADLDADKVKLVETQTTPMKFHYNNYNKQIALILFDPESDYTVDTDWFKDMNSYIKSLPKEDIFTVLGYTYHGDQWTNNHMRGMFQQGNFYTGLKNTQAVWTSCYMPVFFQAKEILQKDNFAPELYIFKDEPVTLKTHESVKYDSRLTNKTYTVSQMLEIINKNKNIPNSNIYMALANCTSQDRKEPL
jgi:predicted metal-binding protein